MGHRANKGLAEAKARGLLQELRLQQPEEIDLELIAASLDVFVEEDQLTSYEARMVRSGSRAIITVSTSILEVGRKRFSIAHELGHFLLHPDTLQLACCDEEDMRAWSERFKPEETEANAFAAELLMPREMVSLRLIGQTPSFTLISDLTDTFQTSLTASAIQFAKCTREPVALIASQDLNRKWWVASDVFSEDFRLREDAQVHPYTCAYELRKTGERAGRASDIAAGAWLDRYDPDSKECITEDSLVLGAYGLTLSLVWIHDEI